MESTRSPKRYSKEFDSQSVRIFHKIAGLAVLAGAAGSLGFTLYTSRNNTSVWLILLFVGWVVSPYIGLLLVNIVSNRWPLLERLSLYGLMLLVTVGSLVMYSGWWNPPGATPAFVFLMVPLLSWFVMGLAVLIALFRPR